MFKYAAQSLIRGHFVRPLSRYAPDYYATLGVSRSADLKAIKIAYFRKAKKYHPDTNPGDDARFMFSLCAEAYTILSNPEKREEYDKYGSVNTTTGGTTSSGPGRQRIYEDQTSEELFNRIFGEAMGPGMARDYEEKRAYNENFFGHGASKEQVVNISFDEAVTGTTKVVLQNMLTVCFKCDGDKSEINFKANICPYCEGSGIETERINGMLRRKSCSYCEGTKMFNKFKCTECAGTGQTVYTFKMDVNIPAGVEDGQILRHDIDRELLEHTIDHHDHVYVKVNVAKSPIFKRDGNDILSQEDISVSQALLGGELFCRGICGKTLVMPIDQVSGSHKNIVAVGKGVQKADGGVEGHHFIELGIYVPKVVAQSQREKWQKIFSDEVLEDGIADGCFEPQHAHKYKNNVIEPDNVRRDFNAPKVSIKEKVEQELQDSKVTKNPFFRFISRYVYD